MSGWKFSITPREDWKQIFTDAWRMERDYFYDKNMHGVDWDAMHEKYFPLVDRVTTRNELSDLIEDLLESYLLYIQVFEVEILDKMVKIFRLQV